MDFGDQYQFKYLYHYKPGDTVWSIRDVREQNPHAESLLTSREEQQRASWLLHALLRQEDSTAGD